jgi:hypothetical protein
LGSLKKAFSTGVILKKVQLRENCSSQKKLVLEISTRQNNPKGDRKWILT